MISLVDIRGQIHNFCYHYNGLQHLNNAGVSVRNLKRIKGEYKADIILFIEDTQERTNDCIFPDGEEWERIK
jgi:hypothetical protein